jgi:hypothetical protein
MKWKRTKFRRELHRILRAEPGKIEFYPIREMVSAVWGTFLHIHFLHLSRAKFLMGCQDENE